MYRIQGSNEPATIGQLADFPAAEEENANRKKLKG
jgi:hypothetical protein